MLTLMAKNRTLLTSLFPQAFNTTMVHCSQSLSQSWKLKVEKKKSMKLSLCFLPKCTDLLWSGFRNLLQRPACVECVSG